MQINIEKGVPIPQALNKQYMGNYGRWAFLEDMMVGDSFAVKVHIGNKEEEKFMNDLRTKINHKNSFERKQRGAASREWIYGFEMEGKNPYGDGFRQFRVWRKA